MKKIILQIVFIFTLSMRFSLAGEKDKYNYLWLDPDKSVYVLQNKEFAAKNTFYTDLGYIKGISSKFQSVSGVKLNFGYFFNEEWAMELFYNKYSNSNNETFKNVQALNSGEPFVRRFNSSYGIFAVWSPFYGKINTFNKIFYFDWSFGIGIEKINAETNKDSVVNSSTISTYKKETFTAPTTKTKFKFHLNKNLNIGVAFQLHHYKAQGPISTIPSKWRTSSDGILSIGFSF